LKHQLDEKSMQRFLIQLMFQALSLPQDKSELASQGYFLLITLQGKAPPRFFEEVLRAGRFAPCPQHLFYSCGVGRPQTKVREGNGPGSVSI